MGQFDAARSKQMGILKENTLEVQGKELEEANHKRTSVFYRQSFRKNVDSDSEEPEMDSEEDPVEDPEEEPEENLEMDGKLCNKKLAVECATSLKSGNEIASKQEFDIKLAAIDQHHVPEFEDAVKSTEKQANFGKRRCSKWDQDPEDDKKEVIEDRQCKKGKIMSEKDLEVQSLKKRFSEISSIIVPLVDDKLEIGVYTPDKLIEEREKIFSELAKRNAIISKELYVPVKEYPTFNFIGLILGPKGNTQKRMELKSGAKIRLRCKDSSESAQDDQNENEDLNVYIEAISQESLAAAVCMVEKLLITVEDEMNDRKRAQLQEIYNLKAASFISSCSVCKEPGHNHLACPRKTTLKAACDRCGNFTHPTSDCLVTPSTLKIKSSREIDPANLYIGFLPQTVDDSRLWELFSPFGTITQLKVALDMKTGYSISYGHVRYDTPSAASLAIMHMDGYQIDGHRLRVRIFGAPHVMEHAAASLLPVYSNPEPANVATTGYPPPSHYMIPEAQVSVLNGEGLSYPLSINMDPLTNLYIGFLPQTVDDSRLWELFSPFGTITQLKVVLDRTGYSKGYGFVRFDTPSAASLAIMHMNGYEIEGHRLTVKIAYTPPVRGQPATNLLHVSPNPGSAAIATSYPASPYYTMQKTQVSILNGIGIGFPSSLKMESINQFSQTEAPIIPQEISWSTGLVSGSTESSTESSPAGLISVSTGSSASLSTVAASDSALPDCMMREAQVSILNTEGLGYPSSLDRNCLTNLYVGFLPQTIDDRCLGELFSPFGTVTQSRVILDMVTGQSKGYGFLRFDSPSAADLAIIHMNGYEIGGHRLAVRRKIAGTPPTTGPLATSLLPHYMLPKEQVSGLPGEGLGFNQFSQTEVPTKVSSAFISKSTEPGTTKSRTEPPLVWLQRQLSRGV